MIVTLINSKLTARNLNLSNFRIPRPALGGVTPADVRLGLQDQRQKEIAQYREEQVVRKHLNRFHVRSGM